MRPPVVVDARGPDVESWVQGGELGGHDGTVLAQALALDRVLFDLVLVQPERRGHDAVDEGQAAPVVAKVLQAVEEEGMRGALAGEGGAAGCTHCGVG